MPLTLYFAVHTLQAFNSTLYGLFSNAKTFVVEYAYTSGLVDYHERLYNKLSKGDRTPEQLAKLMSDPRTDPTFYLKLYEMIYGKRKKIYLERSPLTAEEAIKTLKIELPGSYEENLSVYEEKLRERADCERRRDDCFASQLKKYVDETPDREILTMRGPMHRQPLEQFLTTRSVRFKSYEVPFPAFTESRIVESLVMGGTPTRRDLLIAIAETLEIKRGGYDPKTIKSGELAAVQDKLKGLSEDELKRMYFGM